MRQGGGACDNFGVDTRCDTGFGKQIRDVEISKPGTDARFPFTSRQNVVVVLLPDPNGVRGVAGSNPAVPIGVVSCKGRVSADLNAIGLPDNGGPVSRR
jgi:hypothetical protein